MSYNLKINVLNNRDYSQQFTLTDSNQAPIDITGFQLAFGYGTKDKAIATHTSGGATNKCLVIDDAANGTFTLTLPYSVLRTLKPAIYLHDLVLIDAEGNRTGIWEGTMTVKRGMA